MRMFQICVCGQPLQLNEQPTPKPAGSEVLLKVLAAEHPELKAPPEVERFVSNVRESRPELWAQINDPGRPADEVLHEEHPTPALAEDVDPLQAEGGADRIDLAAVEVDRPAGGIVRLVGVAAALLVEIAAEA